MSHCCAYKCNNQSKLNKSISYHILPKNKTIAAQWLEKISIDDLPGEVYLCADHFTESCFDAHHDMKQRLMPEGSKSKIKRKLNKDAVPTIFAHKSKTDVRETSEKRREKKEQREVIF